MRSQAEAARSGHLSLVFGLFYLRNPNLAGVTLFHFIAGGCAFWFGLL